MRREVVHVLICADVPLRNYSSRVENYRCRRNQKRTVLSSRRLGKLHRRKRGLRERRSERMRWSMRRSDARESCVRLRWTTSTTSRTTPPTRCDFAAFSGTRRRVARRRKAKKLQFSATKTAVMRRGVPEVKCHIGADFMGEKRPNTCGNFEFLQRQNERS